MKRADKAELLPIKFMKVSDKAIKIHLIKRSLTCQRFPWRQKIQDSLCKWHQSHDFLLWGALPIPSEWVGLPIKKGRQIMESTLIEIGGKFQGPSKKDFIKGIF
uniref:hypothetical protein n=1 Tax=Cephaleuros parasiticus TaxID=173370 RepID=UPI001EDFDAEE|nr:hypothetical protein MFQ79_pgp019 [Cephaleuros parasiticus]UIB39043.1 hypothetical protein [Cephaleuros parasiticus]